LCSGRERNLHAAILRGAVKPLLVHFARKEKLTPADLDELKRILKKNEDAKNDMNVESLAESGLGWLWRMSWQASVLVLLVLMAQRVFRSRLTPQWRFSLWWLVLLRLMLPVAPESAWSVFNLARMRHVEENRQPVENRAIVYPAPEWRRISAIPDPSIMKTNFLILKPIPSTLEQNRHTRFNRKSRSHIRSIQFWLGFGRRESFSLPDGSAWGVTCYPEKFADHQNLWMKPF